MVGLRPLYVAIILLSLSICLAIPSLAAAAEPVEVVVEGIEGDVLKNVKDALTLPYGLIREGKVDRLWLERFGQQANEIVRTAMEPFGYYSAKVVVAVKEGSAGTYILRVSVNPGKPVRVVQVALVLQGPGAGEAPLKELVAAFPLKKGGVLLQQDYEEAKKALQLRAEEIGYLDADFSVHEIRRETEKAEARIRLELETGKRYCFDGTKIEGAPDYPEEFLRRYLAYKPGDAFSYTRIGETQLNFTNSERFREVNITSDKEKSPENQVPVHVQLKQTPSGSLREGIGYGTDTGARFNVRYRELNMLNRGQELYSNLYISERLQGLATGYVMPDSKDIRSSNVLQVNLQRENVTTYVSQLAAVELDRIRSFSKRELGTAYIRVQREAFTIGSQDSVSRLVIPGVRFAGDFYDNPIRPKRGYRYILDLRGTHQALGSDTALLQLISEGSFLLPLPWRLSLHTRAKTGLTLLSDPLVDFPPSLRFFAGGDQSVRGYSYQSLGPVDAAGQVVGGKNLAVGSVELERALYTDWGVSTFYDAGNAFDSFAGLRLYQAAGIGVHYYTPVGAMNLSLARQIGVDDPGFRIHFTVGFEM